MTLLSALQCCFGASPKVHAAGPLEEEHEIALKVAEALLNANAQHKVTDLYTLAAPIGHGAFAKVVECTSKVRGADRFACCIMATLHLLPFGHAVLLHAVLFNTLHDLSSRFHQCVDERDYAGYW